MFDSKSFRSNHCLRAAIISLICCGMIAHATPPAWWNDGHPPALDPSLATLPDKNHGMANIGQAKWMVSEALRALNAEAPQIASDVRGDLNGIMDLDVPATKTAEWQEKQMAPLLLGQLKAIAAPFYQRMHDAYPDWLTSERTANNMPDTGTFYPWTATVNDDVNSAPATIGQLKSVFSLHFESLNLFLDSDGDGMPDDWEIANGLDPHDNGSIDPVNGAYGDIDLDRDSNFREFKNKTNARAANDFSPQIYYTSRTSLQQHNSLQNGHLDWITCLADWNQTPNYIQMAGLTVLEPAQVGADLAVKFPYPETKPANATLYSYPYESSQTIFLGYGNFARYDLLSSPSITTLSELNQWRLWMKIPENQKTSLPQKRPYLFITENRTYDCRDSGSGNIEDVIPPDNYPENVIGSIKAVNMEFEPNSDTSKPLDVDAQLSGGTSGKDVASDYLLVPVTISWKAIDGFDNVDEHVDPWEKPIGGKRIFPDFKDPNDTELRDKLQVVVKTDPSLAGKTVYLKAFDVDDSTDETFDRDPDAGNHDPVIDTNGKAGAGDDNLPDFKSTPKAGHFWNGSAWGGATANATLDASGGATFIFGVGMQPGNNYRIVASVGDESMYQGVQTNDPDAEKHLGPAANQTGGAPASELLTVWRRLWVENDSMLAIPEDEFGKRNDLYADFNEPLHILEIYAGPGPYTTFKVPLPSDQTNFEALENGRIVIDGTSYPVLNTSVNTGNGLVQIAGSHPDIPANSAFLLYDDDDYGLETAPLPRNNLIGSFMKSKFTSSFIEINDAGNFNSRAFVTFSLNDGSSFPMTETTNTSKDLTDQEQLWVSLITTAYQPGRDEDGDPEEELHLYGVTMPYPWPSVSYEHSSVFVEACREPFQSDFRLPSFSRPEVKKDIFDRLNLYTIATIIHEMGHQPGTGDNNADHAEKGLMRDGGMNPVKPDELKFSAKTVLRFRKSYTWTNK